MFELSAFQSLSRLTCGYILLPDLGWLDNRTHFSYLKYPSLSKLQSSGIFGVGWAGHRWISASLQFARVGSSPPMIFTVLKPLTISVSHRELVYICFNDEIPATEHTSCYVHSTVFRVLSCFRSDYWHCISLLLLTKVTWIAELSVRSAECLYLISGVQ